MPLKGMTGFGRAEIVSDDLRGYWEARSVNGRGLDMRVNLPSGFDKLDQELRGRVKSNFKRGNFQIQLSLEQVSADSGIAIDQTKLAALARRARLMERSGLAPSSMDGLLAVRGVVRANVSSEIHLDDNTVEVLLSSFEACLTQLEASRIEEGAALQTVLEGLVVTLEEQVKVAEESADKQPDVLRERFEKRISALLGDGNELTEERVAQEAAVFAAKADIREELDRLAAHLVSARDYFASPDAIGRKLDFLCQELNREANTLCSKSAMLELTNAGLAMKAAIDQFKEQVQNVE